MDFTAAGVVNLSARRLVRSGLAAGVLVAIVCSAVPAAGESGGMAVTVVKSKKACFDDVIKLTGFVVARDEAIVRPEVEGYHVSKVLAEDGDVVAAGKKLLELVKPAAGFPAQMPATASVSAAYAGILVVPRPVPIGMPVSSSGDPLFRIIRNGEFDLVLDVPQALLGKLRVRQSAGIETLSRNDLSGIVRSIAPDVDFVSQIGHARVQITGNEVLRPGTFATASIKVETNCDNIRVPLSALLFRQRPQDRQGGPKPVVLVVNNQGLVETRPVKYGLFAGNDVEIKSGLNLDDLVVVRAGTFLNDRDLVRPILVEQP